MSKSLLNKAVQSAEPEFPKAEKVLAKSMMYLTYAGIGSFVVSVGLLAGLIQMKGKKHDREKH